MDCVCLFNSNLFNLSWRSVLYFYGRICLKPLYVQSPVISILSILNFHEVKIRTYLFIPIYALGLLFKHDLYSCLCDLNDFAHGRFTPLSLYFISLRDGLIHVYSFNCCDTYICVKIQICACTGTCTLVLVWCFKYLVLSYYL